jgi:tRNA(adenine34) deaminase
VLAWRGQPVVRAHNARESTHDPTAHAELLALARAGHALERWRLVDCVLYVTLEPCAMCAGALVNARVDRVVYGAPDPKAGAVESLYRLLEDPRLNHRLPAEGGVLAEASSALLKGFFAARRKRA